MSWMQKLCETYDYCAPLIGREEDADEQLLLPVAHTTQKAHIELILSDAGEFLHAYVIADKKESDTVIPCSEKSQVRSGRQPKNYPLFDKLQYLAGDYTRWGGEKGSQFYTEYIADLREWCASPFAQPRVCAALRYFERGTLITDLIDAGILPTDESGLPVRRWDSKYGEKRGVFLAGSVLADALDAFVRFDVETPGVPQPPLWEDPQVRDSYIAFYASQQGGCDVCYVTGKEMPCSEMSPAKIRGTGDKAKLISSNDSSGFTYRGRFETAAQAVRIGYDTTQKAHNALKWLIARQGYHCGDLCYVAWGTHGETLPHAELDTPSLARQAEENFGDPPLEELWEDAAVPDVETLYARKLDRLLAGYGKKLDNRAQVAILGMDSATTGRLSIICYEELSGSQLLARVRAWHATCVWPLRYLKPPDGAPKGKIFVGAPSPEDIVAAAYGGGVSDKLKRYAVRRLMPCILEGARIPRDIMLSAARRASNPAAMEQWEYVKTLCIACALIRKYHGDQKNGRRYSMGLDLENHERSYLFGRVLAYYHYIELNLLENNGSKRPTNAMRLKPYYSHRPATTVGLLDAKLAPYLRRLYSRDDRNAAWLKIKMSELNDLMSELDGNHCEKMSDVPLDETYLLGFASQMNEFYRSKAKEEEKDGSSEQ